MESSANTDRPVTYRDVFGNGNWIRLWAGQTISQLGDFVAIIAFPLLVYEITKSAVGLGAGFAIEALPIIVVSPIAGVFADRWNRRTILLVSDTVRIFSTLGIFFSTAVWQLYVLALIAATMQAIFVTTYAATIPQITEHQFVKAISLSYTGYNTMQVIGPLVAAVLIGLFHGPRPVFLFDAATFALAVLMTSTIKVGNIEQKGQTKRFLNDLKAGANFLTKNAVVRYITGYHTITTIAEAVAILGTLLYIKTALGLSSTASDQLYGLVGGIMAGSLALGNWLIGMFDQRLPKRPLMLWGPLVAGAAYLLFLSHPGTFALLIICAVLSVGKACSLVPSLAFLAQSVPNDIRGRVYSFFNAINSLANLLSYSVFAAVAILLPPSILLGIAGLLLLIGIPLITLVFKGTQALREQEQSRPAL
ncbi:MAG TPA: MFS transporter [Ktedonosporobacter sp.]|jgi:NRE family putative nickel resistance protein-like MFS transporter|nr:MFS transporter [Ktedonosporobacter sp.]